MDTEEIAEAREQAIYALRCAKLVTDPEARRWWRRAAAFWLGRLSDLQADIPEMNSQSGQGDSLSGTIH